MSANDPAIRIMCPNLGCQRVLGVPVHARGKVVRCKACGSMVRIPAVKNQPASTVSAPAAGAPPPSGGESAGAKPAA